MLPCIVIDFLLRNKTDALIIQIYSATKLYTFRASSMPIIRSFSTVHSALVSFMQVSDDRFQAEAECSILTLLGNGRQNLHETYQCRMYSSKLLIMDREDARNMWSFITE